MLIQKHKQEILKNIISLLENSLSDNKSSESSEIIKLEISIIKSAITILRKTDPDSIIVLISLNRRPNQPVP